MRIQVLEKGLETCRYSLLEADISSGGSEDALHELRELCPDPGGLQLRLKKLQHVPEC